MPKRFCYWLTIGIGSLLSLSSCRDLPEYPVEPQISFNSYRIVKESDPNQIENVFLTINYKDGDADLGLGPRADLAADTYPQDVQPPFDQVITDTQTYPGGQQVLIMNPDYFNWYTTLLIKNSNGEFDPFVFPITGPPPGPYQIVTFDGRFPRLSPTEEPQPIDGTITYKVQLFSDAFLPNTIVKFQIHVQDRKLHKSNMIFSPEITINQQ